MSEKSKLDSSPQDATEIAIHKAFENEHVRRFLQMSVLNFSQGLPEETKVPLGKILKNYMERAAKLALSAQIPEPDLSLTNWKHNFANALEDALLSNQEFSNLVADTKKDIKEKFPAIDNPMAFIDSPYMQMASYVSQVAYMNSYKIDPKYVFLNEAEMPGEIKRRVKAAKKSGMEVEFKILDDKNKKTIN